MADEIIDFLRERFNRIDTRLERIELNQREHGQRLSILESQMAQLSASEQGHYAAIMQRLDHLSDRIERIERRFDLVEG